ncbi:MAG: pyridoxal-phosphate dependent enzyme [Planctomycetota bacterium]
MALADAVSIDDIRGAAEVLRGHAVRTPVVTSGDLDALTGADVFLKAENLQHVGAFKFRGAFNAMSRLTPGQRAAGVLTFSSGNHAQAVARSAALLGIRAVIVMPHDAPRVKLDRTEASLRCAPDGSRVERFDPCEKKREELGREIVEREGLTLIPPYDHADVIAGQGTATLELFEQTSDGGPLDAVYICCGGGGLLSGAATVARALAPDCRVYGVEPALADDAARSVRDGVLRTVSNPQTIADGARTPYTGRRTLPIILRKVDAILTVTEREIARAMKWCFDQPRLVVEPSGALGVAGLLQHRKQAPRVATRPRIGVVLSGGNVDLDQIPALFALAAETNDG